MRPSQGRKVISNQLRLPLRYGHCSGSSRPRLHRCSGNTRSTPIRAQTKCRPHKHSRYRGTAFRRLPASRRVVRPGAGSTPGSRRSSALAPFRLLASPCPAPPQLLVARDREAPRQRGQVRIGLVSVGALQIQRIVFSFHCGLRRVRSRPGLAGPLLTYCGHRSLKYSAISRSARRLRIMFPGAYLRDRATAIRADIHASPNAFLATAIA